VVLAIAAAALCAYVAPAAAGSGIPEVKAYLNGVDAPSILAPATLFVKVNNKLSATLSVSLSHQLQNLYWFPLYKFLNLVIV
jgi:H+/Cl- antiporter ClcA